MSDGGAPDAPSAFSVGGTLTGLAGGSSLVLLDNGSNALTLTANGSFSFPGTFAAGTTFDVTVPAQPSSPPQLCTVTSGSGVVAASNVTSVAVSCASKVTVGGTLVGLAAGNTLVLQDNGGDDLTLTSNGGFTFPTQIWSATAYSVAVLSQPAAPVQTCTVSAGLGTAGPSGVTGVVVDCSADMYTVGGTVAGLAMDDTLIVDNAGSSVFLTTNGTFAFPTLVASGSTYNVTISANPLSPVAQTCAVVTGSGSGSVAGADVTSVAIACKTNTSCAQILMENPGAPTGPYTILAGGMDASVYCDMVNDGGGWMLVTPAMVSTTQVTTNVTLTTTVDANGGLVRQVFANSGGCGVGPSSSEGFLLLDVVPWTQIRSDWTFNGANSCWQIFGNENTALGFPLNIIPFVLATDTIRDQVAMGGSNGNDFDGVTSRCDNTPQNFWHSMNGEGIRSAEVILRRQSASSLAGFGIAVSCTNSGPGTMSPTWWEYSNIWVK